MNYGQAIINLVVYTGIVAFGLWFWWAIGMMAANLFKQLQARRCSRARIDC